MTLYSLLFMKQVEDIRQGIEKIAYNVEQTKKAQVTILTNPRMEKGYNRKHDYIFTILCN